MLNKVFFQLFLIIDSDQLANSGGPSPKWKRVADNKVKIPIPGDTESLNASVAAGILIYDVIRQRI